MERVCLMENKWMIILNKMIIPLNVIEDDGTNTLIHDSFNVRMDDDDGNDNENIDDFDDVHDIPLSIREMNPFMKAQK